MLTPWDDYPIHADADPVATPSSANPNHYDRYFFNGHERDGAFYIGGAMGHYPVLGVIDAAFSIVIDGIEHSVFASGRMPLDRSTSVGPIRIDVVEPMRVLRFTVAANESPLTCDLTWRARTVVVEEPRQRNVTRDGIVTNEHTRLTQWGTWEGTVMVDGRQVDIDPTRVFGTRDRSWGMRGLSTPIPTNRANFGGGAFWLWAPLYFDDLCTHLALHEYPNGKRWVESTLFVPLLEGADAPTWGVGVDNSTEMIAFSYELDFFPGSRRIRSAVFHLVDPDGQKHQIDLETLYTFRMRGIGYTHPEFGHGSIHGELEVGHESIKLDDFQDRDPTTWHMQNVVVARMEGRTGIGVLEQALIGPHEPTGLTGFLDPRAGERVRPVDTPEELTPEWLTGALVTGGATVSAVSFEPVGTGQMSSCFRLELDYSAGDGPATMVAKLPSPDPQVREGGATIYGTEVRFYRDIASTVAVRAPECYCGVVSEDSKSFVLLLEDLAPAEQGDQIAGCTLEQAEAAVLNLAGLHGPRWCDDSLRALHGLAPFGPNEAEGMGIGFGLVVEPFIERFHPPRADADVLRAFAPLAVQWMLGRPDCFGLVHGDYRLDNLLFATAAGGAPCAAVDWQLVALGLPARDLGYFLGTGLPREERARHERGLVAAYHDALVGYGVDDYSYEQCWDDYRYGLFQGPLITVLGAMYATHTERGDDMFVAMTERSCAAIRESDALALL